MPIQTTRYEIEKKWCCFECEDGIMRMVLIGRAGEPYYFRKCDQCGHKTKMKRHTEGVEGV